MLNKTQEGPNHRMPVRALRPKITSEATLLRIRPNHRMPVRALRPMKLRPPLVGLGSESSNARQGIKTNH